MKLYEKYTINSQYNSVSITICHLICRSQELKLRRSLRLRFIRNEMRYH